MISIIVPVYNTADYLRECVDSIFRQSYTDWELILVDDGSTDGSGAICDACASQDVRIRVAHVCNGGQARARNTGLDMCTGEYIMFVDSDDMLCDDALESLMSHIAQADIVSMAYTRDLGKLGGSEPYSVVMHSPVALVRDLLYQRRIEPSVCGKLYRREVFEGLRFVDGMYYEDLEIFPRILFACRKDVAISSRPIYYYRDNPSSFINTWSDKRLDALRATDMIEALMEGRANRDGCPLVPAARSRKLSANFNMFSLAVANGRADVADRCWDVIVRYRREALSDRDVRLKNKIGAVLSYMGRPIYEWVCRGVRI